MKLTFDGANARELAQQCLKFAEEVLEKGGVKDERQMELPLEAKIAEPPKVKKQKVKEPEVLSKPEVLPLESPATEAPKKVTKDDVSAAVKMFVAHTSSKSAGTDKEKHEKGINAAFALYKEFGIERLSSLDEKRYHEFVKKIQEAMA